MAVDWIKVETTLPDKPEVVQMASKLKLDQDAICGKLVRIWAWADQNEINGNAIPITCDFIDRATYCPGFSDALKEVGWLEEQDGSLTFPRFDRHNGQIAKKRAETKRRVANSRSAKKSPEANTSENGSANELSLDHSIAVRDAAAAEVDTPPFLDFEGCNEAIRTLRTSDGIMLTYEENPLVWQYEFMRRWSKLEGVSKHNEKTMSEFAARSLVERLKERDWNWQEAMAMFPINWPGPMSLISFLEKDKVQQIIGGKYRIPDLGNRAKTGKPKKDIFAGLRASEEKARHEESVFESFGVQSNHGTDGCDN